MRVFPRRLIALFVLLSFGPLAIGGQGWHLLTEHHACDAHGHGHTHESAATATDGHDRSCSAHSHACCHHAHAGVKDDHTKADQKRPADGLPTHDHDRCFVCQFFAQPQQSAAVIVLDVVEFVCADVAVVDTGAPHAIAVLSYRSRAPPATAHSA